MAKLICSFHTKGGCGKTTVVSSIGVYAAGYRERNVVAVDLDNNGSLYHAFTGSRPIELMDEELVRRNFVGQLRDTTTPLDARGQYLKSIVDELDAIITNTVAALEERALPEYPFNGSGQSPITKDEIIAVLTGEDMDSLQFLYLDSGNIARHSPLNDIDMATTDEINNKEQIKAAAEGLKNLRERAFAVSEFCSASKRLRVGSYPIQMFEDERSREHFRSVLTGIIKDDPEVVVMLDIDRYRPSYTDVAPIWSVADLFDSVHFVVPSRDNLHEQLSIKPYIRDAIKRLKNKGVDLGKVKVHSVVNFAETRNVYLRRWQNLLLGDLELIKKDSERNNLGYSHVDVISMRPGGRNAEVFSCLIGRSISRRIFRDFPGHIQSEVIEVDNENADHISARMEARKKSSRHGSAITLPKLPLRIQGERYCPFLSADFPLIKVEYPDKVLPKSEIFEQRMFEKRLFGRDILPDAEKNEDPYRYKNENPFSGRNGNLLAYAHYFHSIGQLCVRIGI